ncbi:hypothetical protein M440DRAFT_217707 [Trichoderma longibrachiatum ATCC 18648]|uniref:Uncharacterized protein n=1 Tax=Trichoderma longibrachiatum ATCC 18648 TaxID=983965 RepID=A0A2T4BPZ5_TRILO|nr:hypothetical protein M440DRAFT_217707 [Trichoderma longibrachiatum ATCC 18648]
MRLRLPPQDAVRCQGQHHLRFRSAETDPCLESVHDTICVVNAHDSCSPTSRPLVKPTAHRHEPAPPHFQSSPCLIETCLRHKHHPPKTCLQSLHRSNEPRV